MDSSAASRPVAFPVSSSSSERDCGIIDIRYSDLDDTLAAIEYHGWYCACTVQPVWHGIPYGRYTGMHSLVEPKRMMEILVRGSLR